MWWWVKGDVEEEEMKSGMKAAHQDTQLVSRLTKSVCDMDLSVLFFF
jgi:hypothetical protein